METDDRKFHQFYNGHALQLVIRFVTSLVEVFKIWYLEAACEICNLSYFIIFLMQDSPDCGAMSPNAADHVHHSTDGGHDRGVPVTTMTRRVKSVVDKPGSSSKGGKDHSDCAKCNRAQPDLFQTVNIPHEHPEHQKVSSC